MPDGPPVPTYLCAPFPRLLPRKIDATELAEGNVALPRIFDNIDLELRPALRETLATSYRGDFAVGYFNLRGWRLIDDLVEEWPGGDGHCARVLVGMERLPEDELRTALSFVSDQAAMDNQTATRLKEQMAEQFRVQLTFGAPTDGDHEGLRHLSAQLKSRKVLVKLYLRHPLHAKLYLLLRDDKVAPGVAYTGSSNLTLSGLVKQGELNVDVLDHDACSKLQSWFDTRWADRYALDITEQLAAIIDASWARPTQPSPYLVYLKIVYHLSREARAGLAEFGIPKDLQGTLMAFQSAAVRIAAHHLNTRRGVLIGDVVGLGKTTMAAAVARVFQDDRGSDVLIICPKHLVAMWQEYVDTFRLIAKVVSFGKAEDLIELRRYRLVIIDESQNLRNRAGKRYKLIHDYIERNECLCILLSATPYNKSYLDLSSQLGLFVGDDEDLGIRPERLLHEIGETEFLRRHQAPVRSLSAFEKSDYPDDWRDLMRLFLIRRTRSFIKDNYAELDPDGRQYLPFPDGRRFYFPEREPITLKFRVDDDPGDQYGRLYSDETVDTINRLSLPRYGLGNYVHSTETGSRTVGEEHIIRGLSRAGQRLMGFCRTNLFKRLESGGSAFIQSLERHALRNYVYLYAIDHQCDLPIGIQGAEVLDVRTPDQDIELVADEDEDQDQPVTADTDTRPSTEADYRSRAADTYDRYSTEYKSRFRWIRSDLFVDRLRTDLEGDARAIFGLLQGYGEWDPAQDSKLARLHQLIALDHPGEKVLVFTQFADTVAYLTKQLADRGIEGIAGATGDSDNPTRLAWRFSPVSNGKRASIPVADEIRVLISTDVLSEGQNLQDGAIIVNFDLPWALVRLVQRAGRLDRIGQQAPKIWCYSFLPANGVERIIQLRARVRRRLGEESQVVGSDERFFEDDVTTQQLVDLYNEKAGVLDDTGDDETDLASQAYEVWKRAILAHPELESEVASMADVVFSTKAWLATEREPEGVLVFIRVGDGTDVLQWTDLAGRSVTESQRSILSAAECGYGSAPETRLGAHHDLVRQAVDYVVSTERSIGGQLGRPSGARFKTYERLKRFGLETEGTLFAPEVQRVLEAVYAFPLRPLAVDILNRQLRSGISDAALAKLCIDLYDDGRLCVAEGRVEKPEPEIICSMGLRASPGKG